MLSPLQFIVTVWQILVPFYIFLRFPLWSVGMVTSSMSLSNLSSVLCTLTPLTWFQWFLPSTSAVRKAVTMSKIIAYLSVGMHRWTTIFTLLLRCRPSLISQIPAEICIGYAFWLLKTLSRFLYWPHRRGRKTKETERFNRIDSIQWTIFRVQAGDSVVFHSFDKFDEAIWEKRSDGKQAWHWRKFDPSLCS